MLSPDSPATAWILAAALAALVAILISRAVNKDRREYQRFKRYRTTHRRQRMMRRWLLESFLLFGGSSAVLLLLAGQFIAPLLSEVDDWPLVASGRDWIESNSPLVWGALIGILIAVVTGTLFALVYARRSGEIPTIGDIHALLPRNRQELPLGAAMSINAGVVEELLFRLALPAALYGVSRSAAVAVVGSLLLFGFLHIYQGLAGVIGATIIGGLLMALFIGTGNIAAAIIAHALFDLRSMVLIPMLVYRVHQNR